MVLVGDEALAVNRSGGRHSCELYTVRSPGPTMIWVHDRWRESEIILTRVAAMLVTRAPGEAFDTGGREPAV